ncbi:PIR protein [Plasmodium reichenowi]|uniref:PIR protein n=1 Tax=Plasmodium reichenowi TaxID=5854 RepID=A0A2P9DT34_PLARE|nr:PIR protein [Plasmodium reichenowi]
MCIIVQAYNNILVKTYVNTQKNPYITPHHTQTNRSLCESDTQSSSYNNDEDIKSVKENFERQTSQRFEEYEERMKEKRQKYKQERDKNIQEIIEKDKMEKSLTEKIEKGCLKCGCGLGGAVLPVWGLVGALWYATWSQYVTKTAIQKGIEAGIAKAIDGVTTEFSLQTLGGKTLQEVITTEIYKKPTLLVWKIYEEYNTMCENGTLNKSAFFNTLKQNFGNNPSKVIPSITERVIDVAAEAGNVAKNAEEAAITAENAKSAYLYSVIGYSVLAILIIVLVMIIIYLVLRYRRKKKMKKKAQYTKLLNQ